MKVLDRAEYKIPHIKYYSGAILVFCGSICFSAKAILIKLGYTFYHVDSVSLLTLRMVFALPFYIIVALALKKRKSNILLSKNDWVKLFFLGVSGYYLASIFDFEGLQFISAGVERLILFIYPTIVVIWVSLVFKKKITYSQYIALALTYIGMAIALLNDIQSGGQQDLIKGASWILLSAITYAGYMVYGGELIPKIGPLKFTCYAMIFAALAVIIHFIILHGFKIFSFPPNLYWLCLAMGIFSTVVPTFMISEGINIIGSGNASIIGGIGPVSTIVLAYLFLNENVSFIQILGTLVVLVGVIKVSWKK